MKQPKVLILICSILFLSSCVNPGPVTTTGNQASTPSVTTSAAATTTPATTSPVLTTVPATTSPTSTTSSGSTSTTGGTEIGTFYPSKQEVYQDLDGDGIDEKIFFSVPDLKINDISYGAVIANDMDAENSPITDRFIIVDINTSDNMKEIVLMADGPSSDPETYYYHYLNKQLIRIGSVPIYINELNEHFDGNGHIMGDMRLSVLQTWFAPAKWQLTAANQIEFPSGQIFIPKYFDYMNPVELKVALPLYKERGDTTPIMDLRPQMVEFTATDNMNWIEIKGEDGKSGWFKVDSYDYITDLKKSAQDVFENLFSAD